MSATADLNVLNKSSAKIAAFLVTVFKGRVSDYTFTQKGSGKVITAHKFEAWLVGSKAESYCIGYVRGTPQACKSAASKFVDGSQWTLSKVVLDSYTNAMYISTPVPFRVDMTKSAFNEAKNLSGVDQPAEHPVPPRTVADVARINSTKATDLLAFVKSVSQERTSKNGHHIADVVLLDDSKTDSVHLATVTVGVFGSDKISMLKENIGRPMVFFNLSVTYNSGNTNINHYAGEVVVSAPDSAKTIMLASKRDDLASASLTQSITTVFVSNVAKDVSGPQALSCAAFLDYTQENTCIQMPEVVQIMWVHVEEPEPDETVTDVAHQRVWFRIHLRDASGSVLVGVSEKHALKLASCESMPGFIEKHRNASLNMPLLCHVRVSRTVRRTDAGAVFVNHVVEDAMPVTWSVPSAPNAAYHDLLQLLNMCPAHDQGILFAFLSDITEDPHYGFQMSYDGVQSPRSSYVIALIASEAKSTTTNVGEGYQVTSPKIQDLANPDAGALQPGYSVVGFCTLDNLPAFRLDPPRGKPNRCAVCLFSRRQENTLHVHKLECLEPDQVENAVVCFQKLRKLSKGIHPEGTEKKSHDVKACAESAGNPKKKARLLQAVPTDASLE